ncbi:MAG: hypothetical protein ACTSWR_01515 [Candidatus Helarchaeota archaeon]
MISGWNIFFAMIFEICISSGIIIISGLFIYKYLKNRTKPRLYMAITMIWWILSGVFTSSGRIVKFMDLINTGTFYSYTAPTYVPDFFIVIALTCFAIGNSFLMIFLQNFFKKSKVLLIIYLIINAFAIISMSWLSFTITYLGTNAEQIFTDIWSFNALCTLFVTIYMAFISFRSASRTNKMVIKRGSQFIGLSGVFMLFINIFFVLDEIITPGFGGAFTIFYYLAWIFVVLSELFVYLGFILPKWLRRRWEK